MRILCRLIFYPMALTVCLLVMYFGNLPLIENKLTKNVNAGTYPVTTELNGLFLENSERAITRRWLATREGSAEDATRHIKNSINNRVLYAPSWLDLAEIYMSQGKRDQALQSIEVGKSLWPTRKKLLWRAAMLQIQLNDVEGALESLKAYVLAAPKHTNRISVIASRLEPNPEKFLDAIIPTDTPSGVNKNFYLEEIFEYAIKQKNQSLASATWQRLHPSLTQESPLADRYVRYLITSGQRNEALDVWETMYGINPLGRVFNGGFEIPIKQDGFGWVMRDVDGVKWDREDDTVYSGNYSLRVEFDGRQNVDFRHLNQRVAVVSGMSYRLTGYWRGAYITTRSNPYIALQTLGGLQSNRERSQSNRLSWDWEQFSVDIKIPHDSEFLRVSLVRAESDSLDNQISGKIWLDDIQLNEINNLSE